MEFEEMQIIWNNQNNEKLYAINEATLYKQVQRKSRSAERKLDFVEFLMIFVNIIIGGFLIYDVIGDGDPFISYILPIMYLGFGLYGLVRRLTRRRQEIVFAETMLGELDKAIWRIDYTVKQGYWMLYWYLLPLLVVLFITTLIEKGAWNWSLTYMLLLLPAAYYGMGWEARKWHWPKKEELESLRELLQSEAEA